ncbi:winged helix-turn-helix transcriptional regulator [Shinella sp. PSBB067]|uniref:MarR family winged helix-turn-helix transcriptional regulator n=1 Tax=Shinella sp. PSBB067 TaxID=2715959 RepID=UPI00193AE607|nr:MarR family winged helix-turn-helix transcriptional regulator [Shinella sp. PSBB067]QRI63450.1 winged helix-turn-helix transcriptional regulator [Shinella sp. PSBB067]
MELTKERRGGATTKQGLRDLFRCMEVLRGVNAGMPMQMASVFLMIAMKPGIHQRDLGDLVSLSQSSISRNVNALAAITRHGTPGLGLVEQRIGSLGAKSPELHLSATGKALVKRLLPT